MSRQHQPRRENVARQRVPTRTSRLNDATAASYQSIENIRAAAPHRKRRYVREEKVRHLPSCRRRNAKGRHGGETVGPHRAPARERSQLDEGRRRPARPIPGAHRGAHAARRSCTARETSVAGRWHAGQRRRVGSPSPWRSGIAAVVRLRALPVRFGRAATTEPRRGARCSQSACCRFPRRARQGGDGAYRPSPWRTDAEHPAHCTDAAHSTVRAHPLPSVSGAAGHRANTVRVRATSATGGDGPAWC